MLTGDGYMNFFFPFQEIKDVDFFLEENENVMCETYPKILGVSFARVFLLSFLGLLTPIYPKKEVIA